MNSTPTAQQRLSSFDELSRSVIELSCEAGMVHIDELLGGSRKKEVLNVRSLVSVILRENGYTYQSISDILGVDLKVSHTYVMSHDNRMADKRYSALYNRVTNSLENVGVTYEDLHKEVKILKVSVEKIKDQLNHIKKLLTND